MSLNRLTQKKKQKLKKTPITITDDVYDLIMDITRLARVDISSSKEEFVSNHVKSEIRDRLTKIKEAGYYVERIND